MPSSHCFWRQAVIICKSGYEDLVSDLVFETGFTGLIEESDTDGITFTAVFESSTLPDPPARLCDALKSLERRLGTAPARIADVSDIPPRDWESAWREGLDAAEIGNRLVVRPSWVTYENRDHRIEVIIDPRMAFGTGHHPTTALCLEALETLDLEGKKIIDAGIGSGVLAIAAVKLGAHEAHGFDHDEWSVQNARENATANHVSDRITVYQAELSEWTSLPADIVLANLTSGAIVPNIVLLRGLLAPGGTIVVSGILAEEEESFIALVRAAGFLIHRIARRGEWIAVTASRQD
ncbi:50S ribosomal protein L11 methyltransferase [Candidatus Latescibacterota bacterium]